MNLNVRVAASVALLVASGGMWLAHADAGPHFDSSPETLFPTLGRPQDAREAASARQLAGTLRDLAVDPRSVRQVAATTDETYFLGRRDDLVCLIGVVGPAHDRVYASSCSDPDVIGNDGLPLVIQRRPTIDVPLEAYGAVAFPESSIASAPAGAAVAPGIVVFAADRVDDLPASLDVRAADGTHHELKVRST